MYVCTVCWLGINFQSDIFKIDIEGAPDCQTIPHSKPLSSGVWNESRRLEIVNAVGVILKAYMVDVNPPPSFRTFRRLRNPTQVPATDY